jgi:hypothetical protein
MKRIQRMAVLVVVCASCSAPRLAAPTQSQADAVAGRFPGVTLAQLELGKSTYAGECQTCHKLYKPAALSESEWNEIVPEMVVKANKKAGKVVVDPLQQEAIVRYLAVARTQP